MKTKLTKISVLLMVIAISIQLQAQTQSAGTFLLFRGTNQYVSGTTGISTSLTAITIEAWVNHNTLPAGAIQRYVTINPEVAVLRYDGSGLGGTNELHFYIKNASGAIVSLRVDNVLSTTWMHIAGTYDGTTMKLYLNGRLLKSGAASGLTAPSGSFLFSANSAEAFDGAMDEVSIWNYARTMADIREDMYRAAPIANANLINYWQFNNGGSNTLTDSKGTATGTLYNMDNVGNWYNSHIPFAAGAVNTQRVTATGTKTFTGTGLVTNFTAKSGTDTIVASRIDNSPNTYKLAVTKEYNSQYWVINRFGTGSFTANLTFTVSEDLTSAQQAHPSLIKLYKRNGNNDDDGSWSQIATATSVNAVNNTATFNGITSFDGQYLVCENTPSNTPGTAINFNGTDAYVNCGNATGLNITGSITVEAWINATAWKTNVADGTIISKELKGDYSPTTSKGYVLRCGDNGRLSFAFAGGLDNGTEWDGVISNPVMSLNQWTHVAGVYDGSIMSIYVNGVLVGQQSVSVPKSIGVSSNSLLIGRSPAYSDRVFAGTIDEVSIWNVSRNASQISSDMYNTLASTETGLVSYWQCNNGSGTNVTDAIGASNGTINGTSYQWVQSLAMMLPTANNASNITSTGFTANWSAPAVGTPDGYNLYVATDSTFTNMLSGYNPKTTSNTSYAITGLKSYQNYYYIVRATKTSATGLGIYSGFKKGTPFFTDVVPSGSGTSGSPYQLSTISNIQWLKNTPDSWNKYFILMNNINASNTSYWDNGNGFTPIGNKTVNFTGEFNGQGYSIDSICINRSTTDSIGFFGLAVNASIKNLGLTNQNIKGRNNVGGLIGQSTQDTITNCFTNGSIQTTGNNAGGLIGYSIQDTISTCYTTGSIQANGNNAGGLIGYNMQATISKSYTTGSVRAYGYNAGGLTGYSTGKEEYSYSMASVTAYGDNAGGLFGNKAGGLANQCYATGPVLSALDSEGGIAGAVGTGADIENSYWDTDGTEQSLGYRTNAGTFNAWGKTYETMMWKSTYAGWNFATESTDASNEYWYKFDLNTSINKGYPAHFYASEPKTNAATNIGSDIATLNWNITKLGTPASTYHGVCWNTTGSPTLADSKSEFASPTVASFSANATNLIPNTTYYFRAYTRSAVDTKYGAVLSFTTHNGTKPAGDGSAANPFRIANIRNLEYLSTTSGLWNQGYTFIQTANINAAETRNWDGGQGFVPLGISPNFRGHYHGKGNSIDSLYINRPGSQYVGFFGQVYWKNTYEKSTIDSLSLTNVNITGNSHVGGLCGYANGFNISHCSVIGGSVTAINSSDLGGGGVGGMFGYIAGSQETNNSTSHCFAAVAVSGQTDVGGFVGYTYGGYINQCYSAGPVSGTGYNIGGFCGERSSLGNVYTLDSSYYDIQASGQATGVGHNDQPAYNHLQGKTTAEMKTQATYDGWDFSTDWKISGSVNNGYPYFDYPTQISTATVSNIANNTATATGSINHIGALPITAHGFCWNTTGTPTLADAKINLGATTTSADYSGSINSFNHNTSYYLRAYAINANDTIYGNVQNFTTTNTPMGVTCAGSIPDNNARIYVPDNNTLDLTNNYSIEVWINPNSLPGVTGDICLIWKGQYNINTPSNSSYSLGRSTTGNLLGLKFDGMVTADNILTPNTWNHIAAVNDNGTRHIYVNGVEYPLTGTPRTINPNTCPLYIDCNIRAGSWASHNGGKFDEMSLWNTVLSQSQIREHMHFPLTGTEPGLVSYWQFNEGSGSSISDKMGINNGTIVKVSVDNIVSNPAYYWHVSTTPFGLGNSNTQVVTTTGTNTFTNTGLAMNFTAKTGMDSIVVARIDSFPNINPTGLETVFDRQYWAVHKYGTASTLTANLTFTISEGFTADDQSVPTKIKLYKRGSMADDSTWVYVASASTVNTTTKQATFNGISDFSQYIIARGACGVYIPDANFRAALLANASINTNGDNEIQCTEAAAYTGGIDVTGGSIADMTGIEAFTNLTELYCADNTITSLNVSGLTSLTKLFCYNNQLTSLDVSTNTALVYLRCYQNQLASLDVSAIGTLLELSCNNNVLTNLDLSSNAALKTLNCQNNSLTSLNVKNGHNTSITTFSVPNNPGLSCIQVDDAVYSATRWFGKDAGAIYSTSCGMVTETPGIAKTVWSVYPNPVSDELIIEADNLNENSRYEFINSVGQVISAGTLMTKTHIQTSHFPMGIYLLKVENGKTFEIRKIVKK